MALFLLKQQKKHSKMPISLTTKRISDFFGVLKVIASILLLIAISWEVLHGYRHHFSQTYLWIQFGVCVLFLLDLLVRWIMAERKVLFFFRNLIVLAICIPYLNILEWSHMAPGRELGMIIGLMPLARAILSVVFVVHWLVNGGIRRLLTAYLLVMVIFTYLAALVFYDFEASLNPTLDGFGNAMWWAWTNLLTVGSPIEARTVVGKVLTVLLPMMGAALLPIFTTYVVQAYAVQRDGAEQKKSDR